VPTTRFARRRLVDDDLPTIWAIPLDEPTDEVPAATVLPFPTLPPERDDHTHLILFRDSDELPYEGFVPKLRSA
jgi:hypothetical protein